MENPERVLDAEAAAGLPPRSGLLVAAEKFGAITGAVYAYNLRPTS